MTAEAIVRPTGEMPANTEPPNPFPGLRPFTEDESDLFFGREREVAAVLKQLEHRQLVVVHGASGCGKSSVVRAGVVPIFRLDALANGAEARVIVIRPADADGPLASLAKKLEREFPRKSVDPVGGGEDSETPPWSTVMVSSPDIAGDISQAARETNATLCLVIDQFEEIFAVNRGAFSVEARRLIQFLLSLGEAATPGTGLGERPLSVILTMRSDYLGQCALWDGFAESVNCCQYLLPKMAIVGVLRAIHEPARRFGGTVTEAAADRLLPVMSREIDGLPILQHALMRSWRVAARPSGQPMIDADTFDAIGGLDRVLSRHADEAFEQATRRKIANGKPERGRDGEAVGEPVTAERADPRLEDAANWILRSLSDLDTDARIIRRSVKLGDLPSETGADMVDIRAILDVFRAPEFNLVMPYSPETETLVDESVISVSHEAVLREWNRISDRSFDGQQPKGLVQREFLDGLVARALSVQARDFESDPALVLNPASTEARLPWFEEIKRRPGWIARYPLQRERGLSRAEQAEEQWRKLKTFMEASKKNLEYENNRLQIERNRVEQEKRLNREKENALQQLELARRSFLIAISCVIFLLLLICLYFGEQEWVRMELAKQGRELEAELHTANFLAIKDCAGRGLEGRTCPFAIYKKYYSKLGVPIPDPNRLEAMPSLGYFGGGLGVPNTTVTK